MGFSIWSFIIACFVNGFFAYIAVIHGSVTYSGAVAGMVVGAALMSGGGFWPWMMLIFFFSSSTFLSAYRRDTKQDLEQLHRKTHVRDYEQVLANGTAAAAASLLYGATGNLVFLAAAAAAISSATADTWAGEVGVTSKHSPRSIITGKPVQRGRSGGITLKGILAGLVGSISVALILSINLLVIQRGVTIEAFWITVIVSASGFISSLLDSVLGATLQVHYLDEDTGRISEHPVLEGKPLKKTSGVSWINNDMVNFLSILAGTLLAALLSLSVIPQ